MEESILTTIKKMLGIEADYDAFDTDIMVNINTVFMTLKQIGIGPNKGFSITSAEQIWKEFLEEGEVLEAVKTLIYLKVKLVFDPPATSFVLESMKNMANELEWRLNTEYEQTLVPGSDETDAIDPDELQEMFNEE